MTTLERIADLETAEIALLQLDIPLPAKRARLLDIRAHAAAAWHKRRCELAGAPDTDGLTQRAYQQELDRSYRAPGAARRRSQ